MIVALIVGLTCLGLVLSVTIKPTICVKGVNINTYWMIALLGAIILLVSPFLTIQEVYDSFFSLTAINPIKILSLFLSMSFLSVFLDEMGLFKYLANEVLNRCGNSQIRLFFSLYAVVSLLTIFTSNDIIILTFTPFICCFSKNANINPIPYLVAQFTAANTFSMMLIIGNPTNIYLASTYGIDFISYLMIMALPTIVGGITALFMLYIVFYKELKKPLDPILEKVTIKDKPMLSIGVVHLIACIVMLSIASYISAPMYIISLASAVSLCVTAFIYTLIRHLYYRRGERKIIHNNKVLLVSIIRLPWELAPFVLSMFILVLSLIKYNYTEKITELLSYGDIVFNYGIASYLSSNLINNIPMSVLFSSVTHYIESPHKLYAVYASIIGSNLGAILTPIGALAGMMWTNILKQKNIRFTFLSFIKYGILISVPTLLFTLMSLWLLLHC